jgi:hypothetical protein
MAKLTSVSPSISQTYPGNIFWLHILRIQHFNFLSITSLVSSVPDISMPPFVDLQGAPQIAEEGGAGAGQVDTTHR